MLDDKEAIEIASGEEYLIFLERANRIKVWVDCNKELSFRLDSENFMKVIDSFICPELQLEFRKKLYQGYCLYTNKTSFRIVRPSSDFGNPALHTPLPDLKDVLRHPENYQFTV